MPPPPWELFVIPSPSILDGLHWKLLGNGLVASVRLVLQLLAVSSDVPVGNEASAPLPNTSVELAGMLTPFDRTVIAAPS